MSAQQVLALPSLAASNTVVINARCSLGIEADQRVVVVAGLLVHHYRAAVATHLVGACTYLLLPFDLFAVQVVACAASFYAHVFFDKEFHVEGSRLQRFAWFRRKHELHFVHHRPANCNFAVIHFFWDRILCTYRKPAGDISCLRPFQDKELEP